MHGARNERKGRGWEKKKKSKNKWLSREARVLNKQQEKKHGRKGQEQELLFSDVLYIIDDSRREKNKSTASFLMVGEAF